MLCKLWILFILTEIYAVPPYFSQYGIRRGTREQREYKNLKNDCRYDSLTCVPKEDCSSKDPQMFPQKCPPYFTYSEDLEYCIYPENTRDDSTVATKNIKENSLNAVEFCKAIGGRLLFFEDRKEMLIYEKKADMLFPPANKKMEYWYDAMWNVDKREWLSQTTKEVIEWERFLKGKNEDLEMLNNGPDTDKLCLKVKIDSNMKLKFKPSECEKKKNVLCKYGYYSNDCNDNDSNRCCYSPSYDYYRANLADGPGSVDNTANDCYIKVTETGAMTIASGPTDQRIFTCDQVKMSIAMDSNAGPIVRIGDSYYYVYETQASGPDWRTDCVGRIGIIKNAEVNEFVNRDLILKAYNKKKGYEMIFGLEYKPKIDKILWENGRPEDFYKSFWLGSGPNFQALDKDIKLCAVYTREVEEKGVFSFRWKLVNCDSWYTNNQFTLCELVIRATDLMPSNIRHKCGQRFEHGILGRSYTEGYAAHELNAQYGEFSWHAAVYHETNTRGAIQQEFKCSGSLIHPLFVTTPAHCVLGNVEELTVGLGEYVLKEDGVLRREVYGVQDVILYPGFNPVNPVLHDVALLMLSKRATVGTTPHIGLGCLPYPEILHENTGAWECFVLGWKGKQGILNRVDTHLLTSKVCRHQTRAYQKAARHKRKEAYNKKYGYHFSNFKKHKYFNARIPDLICAEGYVSINYCMDDPGAQLVCRQLSLDGDQVFDSNAVEYGKEGELNVINAYGSRRFDTNKWYVMGLSHSLSGCADQYEDYQVKKNLYVFTPVNAYLQFLHAYLDNHPDQSTGEFGTDHVDALTYHLSDQVPRPFLSPAPVVATSVVVSTVTEVLHADLQPSFVTTTVTWTSTTTAHLVHYTTVTVGGGGGHPVFTESTDHVTPTLTSVLAGNGGASTVWQPSATTVPAVFTHWRSVVKRVVTSPTAVTVTMHRTHG